jgi:hypothetical protein
MKFSRLIVTCCVALAMAACATTDSVMFVTNTEVGIGADPATGKVNIGYDRAEFVMGPSYPETGGLPPIYADMNSDLKVFNPEIRQIYATGCAAILATNPGAARPSCASSSGQLYGTRRAMVFGTSTNIGLKVSFASNPNGVLPSFILGFKRNEFSVLPLKKDGTALTKSSPDHYGSAIAGISMRSRATNQLSETNLDLRQFMATGVAAENMAVQPLIQQFFTEHAAAALALAQSVPKVDLELQKRMLPICNLESNRSSDPGLDSKLSSIEATVGFKIADSCVDPDHAQADQLETELRKVGLLQ